MILGSFSLCIIFTISGFYPTKTWGNPSTFTELSQALPILTFLLSLFSSAFGMTKFFLSGPVPILPKTYPLNGLLSLPFIGLLFLNLMFGVRIIFIEQAFFATYFQQEQSNTSQTWTNTKSIDPVIPIEYRLLAYLCPCFISFFVNAARLVWTTRGIGAYLLKYPQFLIAPCFTPFMFEGKHTNDRYELRVWKQGTLMNAIYLGCTPQWVFVAMNYYRQIPFFFFDYGNDDAWWLDESVFGLHNLHLGGIQYAILSSTLFSLLIFRMFCTDVIFKNQSKFCKPIHMICCPCPQNCFTETATEQKEKETPGVLAVDNDITHKESSPRSSLQEFSTRSTPENEIESCEKVNSTCLPENEGIKFA